MRNNEIKETYRFKADLHVHTKPVSKCAEIPVKETIDLYAEAGFDSIVLVNHFNRHTLDKERGKTKKELISYYLSDYKEAKSYGKTRGVEVILGLEMRFTENINDYLVYGITESDVSKAYDFIDGEYPEFYKSFKNEDNLILQAHPFRDKMVLQDANLLDGIEVYNMHPNHNSRVALAAKFASIHPDFIITGGTDFHHPGHQAMCALRTKEKIKTSKQLAKILKSGDYVFEIWGNIIIPRQREE